MDDRVLDRAAELAKDYLASLSERPVGPSVDLPALRAAMGVDGGGPLPEEGEDSIAVIERLAKAADPGLVASAGPRYFGFVVGANYPAAVAADWLTSAWDQNAGLYATSPAAAVAEEVAGQWLVDLFGLPPGTSCGFTTGATMANFTSLAAARHAVLRAVGWDVEENGLFGAPPVNVVVGDQAHVTIFASLQMLGLGRGRVHRVEADGQARMRLDALRETLAGLDGPTIVCVQAGNVSTGAFDPLPEIAGMTRDRGAWLHVDGAFGLWAAASADRRHLVAGLDQADSWTTDAHKWLNVAHDSGLVFVRDAAAHRGAMSLGAAYYVETAGAERDNFNWVVESSRRARGFAVYATLRALGRAGVAELVDRCCELARRMADRLAAGDGVEILNDVVLNQVLVRFSSPRAAGLATSGSEAADALTRDVVARVQADGTCWLGGTTWHGRSAMRVSVSSWRTTEEDIDRSAAAILRCAEAAIASVGNGVTPAAPAALPRGS
jgi:glutamate/tyrosine decarboxylase-like PLP-dependent enzyme